jgi:hypothetical protein
MNLQILILSEINRHEEQQNSMSEVNVFLEIIDFFYFIRVWIMADRLCGLVVRVSCYRYIGRGFDSRHYQIFWVVVGLERGPLSLVRSIEELLE